MDVRNILINFKEHYRSFGSAFFIVVSTLVVVECRLDRNPFLSVPLVQRGVRPLLDRFLPPLALAFSVSGGFLFIGIGFASRYLIPSE